MCNTRGSRAGEHETALFWDMRLMFLQKVSENIGEERRHIPEDSNLHHLDHYPNQLQRISAKPNRSVTNCVHPFIKLCLVCLPALRQICTQYPKSSLALRVHIIRALRC
jgi:hypothetical protein